MVYEDEYRDEPCFVISIAARMVGLPVGKLAIITCFIGGAAAGLAGMAEIASELLLRAPERAYLIPP